MSSINIVIPAPYYSKDPQSSELGRRIVSEGLNMIDELGFEQFTFKKLADRIGSTEASAYRYFENKQKLLIYLTTWYWSWLDFRIDYETHHLTDQWQKLERIWEIICHVRIGTSDETQMDISTLRRIVVSESDKTYLTIRVDEINKEGLFRGFKELCGNIAEVIKSVQPNCAYPTALVSTFLEASHQQYFFASHLPSLTEIEKSPNDKMNEQVYEFIIDSLRRILK